MNVNDPVMNVFSIYHAVTATSLMETVKPNMRLHTITNVMVKGVTHKRAGHKYGSSCFELASSADMSVGEKRRNHKIFSRVRQRFAYD